MPLNRFFIEKKNLVGKNVFIEDKEQIHQIIKVLRLKIGNQIIVLDNSGFEYLVNLEKFNQQIEGYILKKRKNKNEPKIKIILCQSLLKHDKFEQVLKFGTSLGLTGFIPIVSERSIVKEISQNKLIRYQKIIKESAEQSGRGLLPKLENLMTFKDLLDFLKNKNALKLLAWEEEKRTKLFNLQNKIREAKIIYLLIGPEGGFSETEAVLAEKNGFLPFSLGKLILRAEIAGVVASSIIFNYNKIV